MSDEKKGSDRCWWQSGGHGCGLTREEHGDVHTFVEAPWVLLRQAALLTELALAGLDRRKSTCACCGTNRFVNYDHHKASEALSAAPTKMREWAGRLKNADDAKTDNATAAGVAAKGEK